MGTVSVCRTERYEDALLDAAIHRHFEHIRAEELIRPGMRVLIKPNLVAARRPETAATTHPALVRALVKKLKDMGVDRIVIADSPGGLYTASALSQVYAASGMKEMSELAELNYNTGWKQVFCPQGFENHWFNLIEPVLEADVVINVAKLKTHSMTMLSAGVKNLFGCVPGLQKPELHYRHPELEGFSGMLAELAKLVAPAITLLDAVDCMEGNGPTGGSPRHMGLTLAARNPFEQDAFAASLMGMEPQEIPMLRIARERGWYRPEELALMGDDVQPADPPFRAPDSAGVDFTDILPPFLRGAAAKTLRRIFRVVPVVNRTKCVGCGKCVESCPPHIAKIENGKAVFPRKGCISCLCCQEMCPAHAISVRRMLRF